MEQVPSLVEGFIVGSPYGRHLGVVTEAIEVDRVRFRLPYRETLTTIADMVHGGAIASLGRRRGDGGVLGEPDRGSVGARHDHRIHDQLPERRPRSGSDRDRRGDPARQVDRDLRGHRAGRRRNVGRARDRHLQALGRKVMILYSGPMSLFTGKVRIALDEKGLAYELVSGAVLAGRIRAEASEGRRAESQAPGPGARRRRPRDLRLDHHLRVPRGPPPRAAALSARSGRAGAAACWRPPPTRSCSRRSGT